MSVFPTKLDHIDIQILSMLQEDGRISNAEMARRLKLTPPSVLQRVRRLEEAGLIRGYAAQLDCVQLGYPLVAFVEISLSLLHENPVDGVRSSISEIPEVLECHNVSGSFDFLIKVIVKDMPHFEKLIRESLSKIPGVAKLQTAFVLHTSKDTRAIPLAKPN